MFDWSIKGMFLEKTNTPMSVTDVLYFCTEKKRTFSNAGREIHALSLRKKANTILRSQTQEVKLTGISLVWLPSNLSYERQAEDEEMIVIHFRADEIRSQNIRVFSSVTAEKCLPIFEKMFGVWKQKNVGYQLKASELLYRILYILAIEEAESYGDISLANEAAQMIRKNIENCEFSVSDIAPKFGISGTYMRKLFRATYHMTMKEYLTVQRLEYATSLLDTGYFHVKEVAKRSGFENEKYFSTVFKKHYQISPVAWTKTN